MVTILFLNRAHTDAILDQKCQNWLHLAVAITAAVSTQLFSTRLSVKNEIITRNNQKFMKLMWQEKEF